jgi:hypothetical protein
MSSSLPLAAMTVALLLAKCRKYLPSTSGTCSSTKLASTAPGLLAFAAQEFQLTCQ